MKDVSATVIIDIHGRSEEDLFQNLEYSRRKNIKKALRNGLNSVKSSSEEDYRKCYDMYAEVIREGGSTPFTYEVWRNWAKSERWDLFLIKKDEKTIGYLSVIEITKNYYGINSNDRGVRPRVFASDKKYHEFRTNDFIYWNTILYGLEKGVEFVDLGGYQLKPRGHLVGVNSFKEKWGGKVFKYELNYPFHVSIARKLVRNVRFFWWLNEKLKKRNPKIPQVNEDS
jgi:lipid II:glycine glycyltransferase (peptidoglycan interpeptide bridge formation enzyme)